MGINIPANSSLGSISSHFFSFSFSLKQMNLTVFAGILLAVTMGTARRASLVRKADEPGEAMREAARPASLVEKIMRAANEADEPDEAKRESIGQKMNKRMKQKPQKPTGCPWAIDCNNPNRDQNEINCCYGSPFRMFDKPSGLRTMGKHDGDAESIAEKNEIKAKMADDDKKWMDGTTN